MAYGKVSCKHIQRREGMPAQTAVLLELQLHAHAALWVMVLADGSCWRCAGWKDCACCWLFSWLPNSLLCSSLGSEQLVLIVSSSITPSAWPGPRVGSLGRVGPLWACLLSKLRIFVSKPCIAKWGNKDCYKRSALGTGQSDVLEQQADAVAEQGWSIRNPPDWSVSKLGA